MLSFFRRRFVLAVFCLRTVQDRRRTRTGYVAISVDREKLCDAADVLSRVVGSLLLVIFISVLE